MGLKACAKVSPVDLKSVPGWEGGQKGVYRPGAARIRQMAGGVNQRIKSLF